MSIYAIHGLLTQRICRQTILWPIMRRRILSRPITVGIRDAHSSLYQMVKKRTLEARSKLQANRFPNNQACASQDDGFVQNQCTTGKTNTKALHISKNNANIKTTGITIPATRINRNKPIYPSYPSSFPNSSKGTVSQTKRSTSTENIPKPAKECRNTEILRARDCINRAAVEETDNCDDNGRSRKSDVGWGGISEASDKLSHSSTSTSGNDHFSYGTEAGSSARSKPITDKEFVPKVPSTSSGSNNFFNRMNNPSNSSSSGRSGAAIRNEVFTMSGNRSSGAANNARANVTSVGGGKSNVVGSITVDSYASSSPTATDGVRRSVVGSTFIKTSGRDAAGRAGSNDPCTKDGGSSAYRAASGKNIETCEQDKDDECCDDNNGGNEKRDRMLLYAFLAALGAGGLLWWLFTSKKSKEPTVVVRDSDQIIKSIPASSSQLPKQVPYVLIGGGTAAFSAFRAIKSNDPTAKVLMITDEMKKPYMRPPLSKELWYSAPHGEGMQPDMRFKQWTGAERSLFFEPEEFFVDPTNLLAKPNGGIAVAQGFKVRKVNPEKRIVTLEDGYEISYDECLIATGCSPKNLSLFEDAPNSVRDKVMVYRTPDDFENLKKYADQNKTMAIIGNGFTGSELACSLANYTKDTKARIYQIFPEVGNMSRVLPQYLSKWTTKKVESTGVLVINQATVKEASRDESKLKLTLSNGKTLLVDVAVVCIGCEPNTELASTSGLEVSKRLGGFVVNSELEARRNLYVAGDASCFYDPLLGRRRVEHHDHSVVSGRLAGENMTGKNKSYAHQSMFWSDLGPEIGYEGIGLVDASLPTVGIFALPSKTDTRTDNLTEERKETLTEIKDSKNKPAVVCDADEDNYGRGVIFYIKDDKIVGVLLWNLFNRIGLARTIITQNKKYDDLNEVAKLFEIHS